LEARYREATGAARAASRTVRQAADGFVSGEAQGVAGTAGAFASDLVGIGDLRDLAGEARHAMAGEPVDRLTLGLSVVGIGLTVGTIASFGAAEPAKAGVALVKEARVAKALTRGFERSLAGIAAETVDLAAWRAAVAGIPWWRADRLAAETAVLARTAKTEKLTEVAASLAAIRDATSTRRALGLLRSVESVEDLGRVETLARAAGKPVSGAFRLAGRRSFAALGKVTVASARIAGSALLIAAGLLLSAVSALSGLLFGVFGGVLGGVLIGLARRGLRWLLQGPWRLLRRVLTPRTPPATATAAHCTDAPPG
jgi:hypothetical protein